MRKRRSNDNDRTFGTSNNDCERTADRDHDREFADPNSTTTTTEAPAAAPAEFPMTLKLKTPRLDGDYGRKYVLENNQLRFIDGVALVPLNNNGFSLIDENGNIIFELEPEEDPRGLLRGNLTKRLKCGLIETSLDLEEINGHYSGRYAKTYYDLKGNVVISPDKQGYDETVYSNDFYSVVSKTNESFDGNTVLYGILDMNGEWVMPLSADSEFSKGWLDNGHNNGLFSVKDNDSLLGIARAEEESVNGEIVIYSLSEGKVINEYNNIQIRDIISSDDTPYIIDTEGYYILLSDDDDEVLGLNKSNSDIQVLGKDMTWKQADADSNGIIESYEVSGSDFMRTAEYQNPKKIEGNNYLAWNGSVWPWFYRLFGDVNVDLSGYLEKSEYGEIFGSDTVPTFNYKNGRIAFVMGVTSDGNFIGNYLVCLDSNGERLLEPIKVDESGNYCYLTITDSKIIFSGYYDYGKILEIDFDGNVTEREIDGLLIDYDEKSGYYITKENGSITTYYTLDGEPRITLE